MPVNIIGRSEAANLIPVQEVQEIIKMAPQQSVMLSNARIVRMTSKKHKQPVLSTLPEAYWVNGDTGLKSTSKADWAGLYITAEELAVIVPIPDAVIDDSSVPLWPEIRPLVAEAIGKKVDGAAIFDVDRPESWPQAIVPAATAAGNYVTRGTGKDLGVDVASLGKKVAEQGYGVNGFISKPGMQWELVGLRDDNGQPIYTPIAGSPNNGLYGYKLNEVMNGSWNSNDAELIALDWSKQLIGIRQDVTYEIFKEGVISDANGKVLLNLMQQDTKALRIVFRVGYAVAKPLTRVQGQVAYPGGVILPASPFTGMTVAAATKESYWGHTVASLQTGLTVANGAITGTLHEVTSGTLANDWGPGYFMALKFTNPDSAATSLRVGLEPSEGSGLVELDSDMDGVFKVTDKDGQKFVTVTSAGTRTSEKVKKYDLSGLVLD
jgi:HK97 family phage major capsid protein